MKVKILWADNVDKLEKIVNEFLDIHNHKVRDIKFSISAFTKYAMVMYDE